MSEGKDSPTGPKHTLKARLNASLPQPFRQVISRTISTFFPSTQPPAQGLKFKPIKGKWRIMKRPKKIQVDDMSQYLKPLSLLQLKAERPKRQAQPQPKRTRHERVFTTVNEQWKLREEQRVCVAELLRIYQQFRKTRKHRRSQEHLEGSLPEQSLKLFRLLQSRSQSAAEDILQQVHPNEISKWAPYILIELSRVVQADIDYKLAKLKEATPEPPSYHRCSTLMVTQSCALSNLPKKIRDFEVQFGKLQVPSVFFWTSERLRQTDKWMCGMKQKYILRARKVQENEALLVKGKQ